MKRPDIPALEEIETILKDIEETENALQSLHEKLDETVRGLGEIIPDKEKLIELAIFLYWMIPEIKLAPLTFAITGESKVHALKKYIPPMTADINCDRCNTLIPFNSRNELRDTIRNLRSLKKHTHVRWAEGYTIVCENCRVEIITEREQHYAQQKHAQQLRLHELKQMPYKEYLQTPEWQTKRQTHLRSARYRCQVCNTGKTQLNVHHRTYERRGEEAYKDLIVLCKNCHELFHREGKLAYD